MIIGRDEQIADSIRHVQGVIQGSMQANVLFVTGEAGIGKTTLLQAVGDLLEQMSPAPVVVRAECSTPLIGQDIGEVEALAPWITLMTRLAVGDRNEKLETKKLIGKLALAWVRCIPVVGDVLESAAETALLVKRQMGEKGEHVPVYAANQQQLFQQYINVLARASERSPLVLMIDDFHWADTSSTNLLFTAARELQGKPVVFVIAYRPADAASSREQQGHPILHVRNELERYGLAAEVPVPKMSADNLDALLRTRYRAYEDNDSFEEWLAEISDGNALFITQFLNMLEEDGIIDVHSGRVGDDFERLRIPESASAVVRERIRRLDEESRELLRYGSVEGTIFTVGILAEISETPRLKLLSRLRRVEEKHAVILGMGKRRIYAQETTAYRFSNNLLHRVLYDGLADEERELLHEAILEALTAEWETAREERENLQGIAPRMAAHARVLERYLAAAEISLEGARAAWRDYAEEETLKLLRTAEAMLDEGRSRGRFSPAEKKQADNLEAEIAELRGSLHSVRGRYDAALEDFRRAEHLFREQGRADGECDALAGMADALRLKGAYDQSLLCAERFLARARELDNQAGIAAAFNAVGIVAYVRGDLADAEQFLADSLELCRTRADAAGEAKALNNLGLVKDQVGNYEESLVCFEGAARLFRSSRNVIGHATALNNLGLANFQLGRIDAAEELFIESLEVHQRIGDRSGTALAHTNMGHLCMVRQRFDEGVDHCRKGLELLGEDGEPMMVGRLYMNLGNIMDAQGKEEAALEYYEQGFRHAGKIPGSELWLMLQANIGIALGQQGRLQEAEERLRTALEAAEKGGLKRLQAQIRYQIAGVEWERMTRNQGKGDVDIQACVRKGIQELERALALFDELGLPDEVASCREVIRQFGEAAGREIPDK